MYENKFFNFYSHATIPYLKKFTHNRHAQFSASQLHINSFNTYSNSMRLVVLVPHFTDDATEAQKVRNGEVTDLVSASLAP